MAILETVGHYLLEGYTTLLAYIFVIFLEYLIFTLIFKHEINEEGHSTISLRWSDTKEYTKAKVVFINLAIVLLLIPFVMFPLKNIMHHYLAYSGFYLIPLTFLATSLGYLAATKHYIDHEWQTEDTVILTAGVCAFLVTIIIIIRLGLKFGIG